MPKILIILNNLSIGGAENQLIQLISARPPFMRDVEVELLTVGRSPLDESNFRGKLAAQQVKVETVNRKDYRFPRFLRELTEAVRRAKPDLVHTLLPGSAGTWGRLAAILAGVPVIFHSDLTLYPQGLQRVNHAVRPFLDLRTKRFLPNADTIADAIIKKGVPPKKIEVIPCGVNLERFENIAPKRGEWGIPEDAVVAGFLARFAPVKRLDLLLDAVLALPEDERPDYLVLGGDGPTMPMVQERVAADKWLQERCRVLGTVTDPPGFLASIDYLVLPSDSEGLPNVLLETMASGKTMIASSVADVPALVDGVGVLMEPGNKESLMAAFRRMNELGAEGRAALGERARQRVTEHYDVRRVAERFWRAHLEMIETGEPRASVA